MRVEWNTHVFPQKPDIVRRGRKRQGRLGMSGKHDENFSGGRNCKSKREAWGLRGVETSSKLVSYKYLNVFKTGVLRLEGWHVRRDEFACMPKGNPTGAKGQASIIQHLPIKKLTVQPS